MKFLLDKPYKTTMTIAVLSLFCLVPLRGDYFEAKKEAVSIETPKVESKIIIPKDEPEQSLPITQPKRTVTLSRGGTIPTKKLTQREVINNYVRKIAPKYNIEPELIMSIIQTESEYNPKARNRNCLGLMQVSSQWHKDRAAKLGVTDFYDPYSNILLGTDYIAELFHDYKDPRLVLMVYNMERKTALNMYKQGHISNYAKTILARAEQYKKGE
jgi:soluble lytic murein transglycosylase-like protein